MATHILFMTTLLGISKGQEKKSACSLIQTTPHEMQDMVKFPSLELRDRWKSFLFLGFPENERVKSVSACDPTPNRFSLPPSKIKDKEGDVT